MRDPDLVQKIQEEIRKFQRDFNASVSDHSEQVYGKFLWNTAVKVFGTTRDTHSEEGVDQKRYLEHS